ncbi:16S rRNA (uracil(1498)-N(3))-methyltransferase [Cohnella lubricantis]|uniref:Ribosomal RNA small subunit methyltransferase E n=1 Tax=Cohnella lubricantis TaxID=2163172 RepID=A0A841THP6_9BACL|nr:16S rRNA (uracil(1498)-N(3))-methyltransferase [Cohnella lubricantis]MBB6678758.1 16S rRNA (uracil(1498)-N(3))-methyltransferase [Cohnella lubricantis]MBP2119827.1 16S rRNA (uracil1498-N3)-methyltransferase [Cohnella lubricantis]
MQRYFVPPGQIGESAVTLLGDDARHLATVMRAKPGDEFIVCDGSGIELLAKAQTVEAAQVVADIVSRQASAAETAWRVTVAQSLPKGDKLETVIQKGTEAGAHAFRPFLSQRTIVQYDERKEAKRLERWRKIAKEAAEQAHRGIVPEVASVCSWKALISSFDEYDLTLLCYEEEGRRGSGLQPVLAAFNHDIAADSAREPRVLLIVGPEGGITPQEAEQAAAAGAKAVGLGRRILRTETAALVALAAIAYESGELGG